MCDGSGTLIFSTATLSTASPSSVASERQAMGIRRETKRKKATDMAGRRREEASGSRGPVSAAGFAQTVGRAYELIPWPIFQTPAAGGVRKPRKKPKATAQAGAAPIPRTGPIPKPYLALAPTPISSLSPAAIDQMASSPMILPSSFIRSTDNLRLGSATDQRRGGNAEAGPSTSQTRLVESRPATASRGKYVSNLLSPPTIIPGGTSSTPRIQSAQPPAPINPRRRSADRTRRSTEHLREMAAGNPSMTSLGHLGRIMESDPQVQSQAEQEAALVQARESLQADRRRRRIVRGGESGATVARRLTVSSREEGRAIGLARGASMRRTNVWDDIPEAGEPPPPFPFPTPNTTRLPPAFAARSSSQRSIPRPNDVVRSTDTVTPNPAPPRSPPPSFEFAISQHQASRTGPPPALESAGRDSPTQAPSTPRPIRPALTLTTTLPEVPTQTTNGSSSENSPTSTHYASAPSSPTRTIISIGEASVASAATVSLPNRDDRKEWNDDILAGYTLEERVQREMERRLAREDKIRRDGEALLAQSSVASVPGQVVSTSAMEAEAREEQATQLAEGSSEAESGQSVASDRPEISPEQPLTETVRPSRSSTEVTEDEVDPEASLDGVGKEPGSDQNLEPLNTAVVPATEEAIESTAQTPRATRPEPDQDQTAVPLPESALRVTSPAHELEEAKADMLFDNEPAGFPSPEAAMEQLRAPSGPTQSNSTAKSVALDDQLVASTPHDQERPPPEPAIERQASSKPPTAEAALDSIDRGVETAETPDSLVPPTSSDTSSRHARVEPTISINPSEGEGVRKDNRKVDDSQEVDKPSLAISPGSPVDRTGSETTKRTEPVRPTEVRRAVSPRVRDWVEQSVATRASATVPVPHERRSSEATGMGATQPSMAGPMRTKRLSITDVHMTRPSSEGNKVGGHEPLFRRNERQEQAIPPLIQPRPEPATLAPPPIISPRLGGSSRLGDHSPTDALPPSREAALLRRNLQSVSPVALTATTPLPVPATGSAAASSSKITLRPAPQLYKPPTGPLINLNTPSPSPPPSPNRLTKRISQEIPYLASASAELLALLELGGDALGGDEVVRAESSTMAAKRLAAVHALKQPPTPPPSRAIPPVPTGGPVVKTAFIENLDDKTLPDLPPEMHADHGIQEQPISVTNPPRRPPPPPPSRSSVVSRQPPPLPPRPGTRRPEIATTMPTVPAPSRPATIRTITSSSQSSDTATPSIAQSPQRHNVALGTGTANASRPRGPRPPPPPPRPRQTSWAKLLSPFSASRATTPAESAPRMSPAKTPRSPSPSSVTPTASPSSSLVSRPANERAQSDYPRVSGPVASGERERGINRFASEVNLRSPTSPASPVQQDRARLHLAPAGETSPGPSCESRTERNGGSSSQATTPPREERREWTDLDLLAARIEGSGREFEGFTQITSFLGPSKTPGATPEALATLLPALISVDSRRTTPQGKVKLKLSLLGVRVSKCPICLSQFKGGEKGVMLPMCGHVGHESCARRWFRESSRCWVCREVLPEE
ncbi:hypothetical protein IAU60_005542 [Kwoniella sp. DSM 27419]